LGLDIAIVIFITFAQITKQLAVINFLTIIYTDSYSFYEYIIKLNIIKEKRLIINIIAIKELYKKRELLKIR
jgi:hypothetical protein